MTTGFNPQQQYAQNAALNQQVPPAATPELQEQDAPQATPDSVSQPAATPAPPIDFNSLPPEELQQMYSFYQQARIDRELQELRNVWGDSYEDNYQQVSQFFNTVPEPYQAAASQLNNAWGAQLIAKAIAYDRLLTQQQTVPGAIPPQFDANSLLSGANNKFKFTRSQIRAMSPQDYQAKKDEISQAYAEGLVYNDL